MEPGQIRERLSGFIAEQGGVALVTIENLKRMAGGAVREIWSFDAVTEKDGCTVRRGMVLRRDLPGHKLVTSRHDEFLVLRAAHRDGVPVPEVLWLCEDLACWARRSSSWSGSRVNRSRAACCGIRLTPARVK